MDHTLDLHAVRSQFPGLGRSLSGQTCAFFDGPAGSQTPQAVVDAVCHYLQHTNANHGGPFCTSRASDDVLDNAHQRVAEFLGAENGQCIAFGANMTTLTFALSRTLARTWSPGDEIIVTQLDHDANVTPWVTAAAEAGVVVHQLGIDLHDCTLRMDEFQSLLNPRTRLLAVGLASNATGTINPVADMTRQAHAAGALVFADAVHFAPHRLIDFQALGVDLLACSAYKFFGPHLGILCGRQELLQRLTPDKLRPASDALPDKWMTGTQNHEAIAGTAAAVDYLASLAAPAIPTSQPRAVLQSAFAAIQDHEHQLLEQLLAGLAKLPNLRVWGITDRQRLEDRVPTISFTWPPHNPQQLSEQLAAEGLYVWAGNHYALPFTEAAGLEPDGTLRVGLLHYNTAAEVDRLLQALNKLA